MKAIKINYENYRELENCLVIDDNENEVEVGNIIDKFYISDEDNQNSHHFISYDNGCTIQFTYIGCYYVSQCDLRYVLELYLEAARAGEVDTIFSDEIEEEILNKIKFLSRNTQDVFEDLRKAFEKAVLAAEGYEQNMQVPIYKNDDGTYEIGGVLDNHTSDISDGTFKEIGRVDGWDVDFCVFEEGCKKMTRKEKAQEAFNQNVDKWFDDFCRYEL